MTIAEEVIQEVILDDLNWKEKEEWTWGCCVLDVLFTFA